MTFVFCRKRENGKTEDEVVDEESALNNLTYLSYDYTQLWVEQKDTAEEVNKEKNTTLKLLYLFSVK